MFSASTLLDAILRYRLDAVCLGAAVLAACDYCQAHARRHDYGRDFSRATLVLAVAIAGLGALLAEWLAALPGASIEPGAALLARLIALAAAGAVDTVLLSGAMRMAALRAELRARTATERQLQLAKNAAVEASRAKSEFLAVMSHEIRTPLNAVMGFANLLAETRLDDAQRNYLGTITSEGSRLASLINDILDLTKIEEGRLVLERLPFAPAEAANDVLRLLSARAQENKIELRFEAQLAGPLLVTGDPLRFRQVLVNLVDNAIKFTPVGSVTLLLGWTPPSAPGAAGQLAVSVRDTGIGIPSEKLKDLFQMFMQVDTSTTRRYGGTGLGLAICQRLVALMGGEIRVFSAPGQGTEFSFTLPFPAVLPAENQALESESNPAHARPPRVLIVDDMETNRFLLEVFLRRHGFEPALASGGEEAVRLCAAQEYDAVLMDLHMPDIDGYTATQRIRAAERPGRHVPIIALTASIAKGTREKCLAAGMDGHLTKPLDLRKFKTLLNSLIARDAASPGSGASAATPAR